MAVLDLFLPLVQVTGAITVRAATSYLADHSDPASGRWFWSYHIRVDNGGDVPVRLMTRRWIITDGHGARHVVEGDGVVGQQPTIMPGDSYDYVSGCPLATPHGRMEGSFAMIDASGHGFRVAVPEFLFRAGHDA